MAHVVFRAEVIEEGELGLVTPADLKVAIRTLRDNPERGKPLQRELAGCRSLRIEGTQKRLVYRIRRSADSDPLVEILGIGPRREGEIHQTGRNRL
jgi:plasmid stabilization system protein ParE